MHHIRHFPVFKESSITAMEITYYASAKISSKALSLNVTHLQITQDNLHSRYRKGVLTNRAKHSRQGCYEILWLKDVAKSTNNPNNLVIYRFSRVLFVAAPSPYLLNVTI